MLNGVKEGLVIEGGKARVRRAVLFLYMIPIEHLMV